MIVSFHYSQDNATIADQQKLYIFGSTMAICVDDEFDSYKTTNQTVYESYG